MADRMGMRRLVAMREPWPVVLCGVYCLAAILLCWRWTWVLFVLLAVASVLLMRNQLTWRNVVLWCVATIGGLYGEYILAGRYRIWVYAQPDWHGLPAWLFWVYGTVLLVTVRLGEWAHGRFTRALMHRPVVRKLLLSAGVAVTLGYMVMTLRVIAPVYAQFYMGMALIVLVSLPGGRDLFVFWITALLGLLGEVSCISAGVWRYDHPFFARWGIPISLPLAWGLVAVLMYRLSVLVTCWKPPGSRRHRPELGTESAPGGV